MSSPASSAPHRARPFVLLACGLLACGPDTAPPAGARAGSSPRAVELDDLGVLGYAEQAARPSAAEPDGVTVRDSARVSPGLNLYTDEHDRVLLVDLAGALVHAWRIPGFDQVEFAELLPDGGVVAVSVDQGVARVDREGRLVWRFTASAHHEVAPLRDGGFVTLVWAERTLRGRRVRFDELVWLSEDGRELRRWSTWTHRAELRALHAPLPLDEAPLVAGADASGERAAADGQVYDYYHLNSVAELGETDLGRRDARFAAGNLLVCARNASLLFVLDPERGAVVWSFGPGELDFPHMPRPTAEGTFTVFDNGWHRGWSRLVELAPDTGALAWTWRATPPDEFFSKRRGSLQRLPNGNSLACESDRGRAFELTPDGALVWEFRNPERTGSLPSGARRRIYRFERVSPERARAAGF